MLVVASHCASILVVAMLYASSITNFAVGLNQDVLIITVKIFCHWT